MIIVATLITAVVLTVLFLRTKKETKKLDPIKVRVKNNRRLF